MTPEQEAWHVLEHGLDPGELTSPGRAAYDRLMIDKSARDGEEHRKLAAETTWLPDLGVAVRDGNVYRHGPDQGDSYVDALAARERRDPAQMKLLGPLAGAHAEVVSGKVGKRRSGGDRVGDAVALTIVLGPVGLLAGISRGGTGLAVVTFPDGSIREKRFTDKASLAKAQAQAAQFNTIADRSAQDAAARPAQDGAGVAAELERLATLHSSGVLDDEEFRAAKARIIGT